MTRVDENDLRPTRSGLVPAIDQVGYGVIRTIVVEHVICLDGHDLGANIIEIGPSGDISKVTPTDPSYAATQARKIDRDGLAAIPLLADAHAHLALTDGLSENPAFYTLERVDEQLRHLALRGIGHVHSLGTDQRWLFRRLSRRVASGDAGEKAFGYAAGIGFGAVDGWPPELTLPEPRFRPQKPDAARRHVCDLARLGCRTLKIWVDDIGCTVAKIPKPVVQAIIDEAKQCGLQTFAHVFYHEDAEALTSFGIDVLAHSVRDRIMDAALIDMLGEKGVSLVPTLAREEAEMAFSLPENPYFKEPFFLASESAMVPQLSGKRFSADPDKPRRRLEIAIENVARAHAGGISIGLGTDSGFRLKPHGYLQHRELALLSRAGLDATACFGAALGVNRKLFATAMTPIAPGEPASFFVVGGNPAKDVGAAQNIHEVWISGKQLSGPDATFGAARSAEAR